MFISVVVDYPSTQARRHATWEAPVDDVNATGSPTFVSFVGRGDAEDFRVEFQPPLGETLAVGTYMVTAGTPDATTGAMYVSYSSSCRPASAEFEILEAPVFDADGQLTAFAATFTADCGNDRYAGTAALNPSVPIKSISVKPETFIDFGSTAVGTATEPEAITIRNVGNDDVAVGRIGLGGTRPDSFRIDHACGIITPGETCTVQLMFRPTDTGFQDAALEIEADDVPLARSLHVYGTGVLAQVFNTTPSTAVVVDELPFVHGGLIPHDSLSSACGASGRTLWYRYSTTLKKRVRFLSTYQVGPPELLQGSSPTTRLQCGEAPGSLVFTAVPGVTYWIRVVTAWEGVDRAVVQLSEAELDDAVQAGSFSRSPTTFYPYRDGYRDTVTIRGVRSELIAVALRVYSTSNRVVRYMTLPSGSGPFAFTWNGRSARGVDQPSGTYRLHLTLTDTWGNVMVTSMNVTKSSKRLYVYSFSKTLDADAFRAYGRTGTGRVSRTASRYGGGVKLTSGTSGAASVAYTFRLPAATVYRSVRFMVLGVGHVPPTDIGLQEWKRCTGYSTSCVDPWSGGPVPYGWADVRGGASNVSGGRLVRGYVHASTYGGTPRSVDIRDVRVVVSYGILR